MSVGERPEGPFPDLEDRLRPHAPASRAEERLGPAAIG